MNSTDILLLAHDEWKRREERRHQHPEEHWIAGFVNGFLTDRAWAREYVEKLRRRPPETTMRNRSQHINPHQKDTSGEGLGYAVREQSERREAEREAMVLLAQLVQFHPY